MLAGSSAHSRGHCSSRWVGGTTAAAAAAAAGTAVVVAQLKQQVGWSHATIAAAAAAVVTVTAAAGGWLVFMCVLLRGVVQQHQRQKQPKLRQGFACAGCSAHSLKKQHRAVWSVHAGSSSGSIMNSSGSSSSSRLVSQVMGKSSGATQQRAAWQYGQHKRRGTQHSIADQRSAR